MAKQAQKTHFFRFQTIKILYFNYKNYEMLDLVVLLHGCECNKTMSLYKKVRSM